MSEPKILVVDDDEALRQLVARRIERLELDVDRANDGAHALQLISEGDYDLIVTDIYMPDVTGIELMEAAKEEDPHTQVIVISASATVENAIEALNLGAFSYLTKPFDHVSAIDNAVTRALELRSLILDNQRMVKQLQQRASKLEEEVSKRSQQISLERESFLELLGVLPVGVVIVEEGGKVALSSPKAKQLVEEELRTGRRAIKRFLEAVHGQTAGEEEIVRVGKKTVKLNALETPNGKGKKRKVVVLHEQEEEPISPGSLLLEAVVRLKQSLVRLHQEPPQEEALELLRSMAGYVADLERFLGLEEGPSSEAMLEDLPLGEGARAAAAEPAPVAQMSPPDPAPAIPVESKGEGEPEQAPANNEVPNAAEAEAQARPAEPAAHPERAPSGEEREPVAEGPAGEDEPEPKKPAFKSGLLKKGTQIFGRDDSDKS